MMFYDYNKRNYLLPPGCKDLIDLLKLEELKPIIPEGAEDLSPEMVQFLTPWKLPSKEKKAKPAQADPAGTGSFRQVEIPQSISVLALAELVGQKPFQIIADFMALGVFSTAHELVSFDAAATLLKKYGLIAKRAQA